MNIVCNSPKFEVSSESSSYFNLHMPGYFDVKPLSSPAQTPYFDALTSPFINNNFNSLNNDDINNHQQHNSLSNKRPNSMPSGSSFASNSPFQEFSSETVESLLQQLDQQQRKTILLLDIRPYSSFSNDRIKSSIHLCAPTTLIKRPAFTIDSLLATLVNDADRQIFREWRPKVKIGFLKGGFPSFSSKFPGLCEKVDSNNNNNSGTFPRRRLSLGRKPGPFTCPTPVTESSNVNHFFNNIRQNIEGVAITETIPIRIPTQNNISLDQSKLPPFIRDVAFKDNGRMKLAELFLEIETTEQNRLKSLMIKNSNIATLDDPYSISAGIEKGTKNRYNNIWPYDHARVKINECKEGDCDYVNASFLQAKGCNKRYIATQGPLPTTYEDFWKIVWEQNSRLIVMLTKEEEAGRIQCHRYWSESASNPCGYDNTIIIRKFKLSHKNHPNSPPREITQLHFLGWPDFGTPETPINILKLIDVANDLQSGAEVEAQRQHEQIGPMIVHCSAGCGRTGTFCTIDTVISILSSSSSNDYNDVKDIVQSTILNFREQRLSIVQNLRQFVFCYEAILWKLVGAI
ncbi:6968_t:CDS:2 [Entrophospora sp. SA101]|nr:6968_t:CDS:2 [Entrophospora sp. SA101]